MAQQSITVRKEKAGIAWILDGRRLLEFGWKSALDVCAALRSQIRAASAYATDGALNVTPEISVTMCGSELSVRQEGAAVLVLGAGRLLFSLPWRAAERLWKGTLGQARKLEEIENAEQVIFDGALLLRTGAPFGITDHPRLRAAVGVEAAHNRTLRRALPGGVKGLVLFGAPTVQHTTPRPDAQLRAMLSMMSAADKAALRRSLAGSPGIAS